MVETNLLDKFKGNPGLNSITLRERDLSRLPDDYIDFLKVINGGEGFVGSEYLFLYRAEEIKDVNSKYQIEKFDPNIVLIGNNGSSEAVAIQKRGTKYEYIILPFIFEHEEIIKLGSDINSFLKRLTDKGYF